MGRRNRQREKLAAPTADHTDADGNVLDAARRRSRPRRGASTPRCVAGGSTREDTWHRAVEFLFERLAVRWVISGVETDEAEGAARCASAWRRRRRRRGSATCCASTSPSGSRTWRRRDAVPDRLLLGSGPSPVPAARARRARAADDRPPRPGVRRDHGGGRRAAARDVRHGEPRDAADQRHGQRGDGRDGRELRRAGRPRRLRGRRPVRRADGRRARAQRGGGRAGRGRVGPRDRARARSSPRSATAPTRCSSSTARRRPASASRSTASARRAASTTRSSSSTASPRWRASRSSLDDALVDAAFSGTQKCLNCPPGLAPFTAGERAIAKLETPRRRRCGPGTSTSASSSGTGDEDGGRAYHHTAPINMVYALREALAIVHEEGLEARWERHAARARAAASRRSACSAAAGSRPRASSSTRCSPSSRPRARTSTASARGC